MLWWPASAFRVSQPPTGCSSSVLGVTVLDDVLDERTSDKGKLLEVLGGSVRLGPGATATLPDDADLVITTGWPATAPLLRQAAERERADLERSGAGVAAQPARQDHAVARDHRHERQDHDHPDAGVDPCSGRLANGSGRQHWPPDHGDRSGPAALRRTRRRAVQSSTALVQLVVAALRRRPQCAGRSSGVARLVRGLPRRQGQDLLRRRGELCLQRRRSGHRTDGRRCRSRRGRTSDRFHTGQRRNLNARNR